MNTISQEIDGFRRTPDGKIIQGASHTSMVLNHKIRNKVIIKAVCDLRKITTEFDSIVCCGVSGLMVVPQISEILQKHIVVARKENEERYSNFFIEGVVPRKYIIVDDLICSGNTIRHILTSMKENCARSECFGVYCYLPEECVYAPHPIDFAKEFKASYLNPLPQKT
jgi:adenine/guanine phosphoribosyltransferase-like PRPP-binding protein